MPKTKTRKKNAKTKARIKAKIRASTRRAISAAIHCRRDMTGVTRRVTALCDAELLGRKLRSGDCVLDLKKYNEFYDGELVNEEKAAALAADSDNLNVVGAKALAAARLSLEISEANVKKFGRVPHAQVYKI